MCEDTSLNVNIKKELWGRRCMTVFKCEQHMVLPGSIPIESTGKIPSCMFLVTILYAFRFLGRLFNSVIDRKLKSE